MKILCVHGSSKAESILRALGKLKIECEAYPKRLLDTFVNEKEAIALASYCRAHSITHILSIHMIDTLVAAAGQAGIAYISLIWDAPYHKLFTEYGSPANTLLYNCNLSVKTEAFFRF